MCTVQAGNKQPTYDDLIQKQWVQGVLLCILDLFVYLGFYVAFNTVQVISQRVVGRAEETST